jgi:hypothetical protein
MSIIRKEPKQITEFNDWRWFFEDGSEHSPAVELSIATDWSGDNWTVTLRVHKNFDSNNDISNRALELASMIFEANAIRERMTDCDFAELNEAREARRAEMKRAQAERIRKLDAIPRFGGRATAQLLKSSVDKVKQQHSIGNGVKITLACTPTRLENESETFFELTADDQNRAVFRDEFGNRVARRVVARTLADSRVESVADSEELLWVRKDQGSVVIKMRR